MSQTNQIKIIDHPTDDDILVITGLNPRFAGYHTMECSRDSAMGHLATEVLKLREQQAAVTERGSRLDFEKFMINEARDMTEEMRFRFLFSKWKRHCEVKNALDGNMTPTLLKCGDDGIPDQILSPKPGKRRVRLLRQDKVVRVALKYRSDGKVIPGTEGINVAMSLSNTKLFWIQFDNGESGWFREDQLAWMLPGTNLGKYPTRMKRGRTDD
jgi:hypothetical protein